MTSKAEHHHCDKRTGRLEAVRHLGNQSDLGVRGLAQSIRQVVLDRGEDPRTVFHDSLLQLHELRDSTATRPPHPPITHMGSLVMRKLGADPEYRQVQSFPSSG